MGQQIHVCQQCGAESLVSIPGRRVAACYVTIGYANATAWEKMQRVIELLNELAEDMPYQPDLARAAQLLREVDSELVAH